MKNEIFQQIDKIIERIDNYRKPIFSTEIKARNEKKVSDKLSENEIIEIFTTLIVYSQNANSKLVEQIINTGIFKEIFANFEIEKIIKMNPCDLADKYWDRIGGIRQQAKLFHIVSLARKIKRMGSFNALLTETEIPKEIKTEKDIDQFWIGFNKLKKTMEEYKVPFFRSTTSLLHFLLETGYDCVKPDLVVMRVSKKIGIVNKESGETNLIETVRTIQEYSLERKIRPSIVDLYFLVEEGQRGAKKFVEDDFYKRNERKLVGNTL